MQVISKSGYDVKRITVLNSKGGSGKSILATNIASIFATNSLRTTLIDYDPQGTAIRWLKQRSDEYSPIHGINATQQNPGMTRSYQMRVPAGTDRMIIDTPAGIHGLELNDFVINSDYILIPVIPSDADIHATTQLIANLLLNVKIRSLDVKVAVIANRVKKNTKILNQLDKFLQQVDFPFVGRLRDTQNYVNAAKQGIGIHEMYPPSLVKQDVSDWDDILKFVEDGLTLYDHKELPPPILDENKQVNY
ncbi:MAG: ParA family protein [Proteobacteria bacterium]|nr:ParA family protein [Pseudomonadota bacterium]NOG60886.1 ParA family protein [Pseudomonadota bacterium]